MICLRTRRLVEGEDVVKQGDDADFCFIIRSGQCDVLISTPDPTAADPTRVDTRCVVTLAAGALVGEIAIFSSLLFS